MQEIKDEDRIIGKICRGLCSITDKDIENLANANLTEKQEENFRQLAKEINETIDRNQSLRQEMKQKVVVAEQKHGEDLEIIDEKIELLESRRDKLKYGDPLSMMLWALIFVASGLIPGFIVGMFTDVLWIMATAVILGAFTGLGVALHRIYKNSLKADKIGKQIQELKNEKLAIIEQCHGNEADLSKAEENEVKNNIVKNIYKTRKIETEYEDELQV